MADVHDPALPRRRSRWRIIPWTVSIGAHAAVIPVVLVAAVFVWTEMPRVAPIAVMLSPAATPPPPPAPRTPRRATRESVPVVPIDDTAPPVVAEGAGGVPSGDDGFGSPFGVEGGIAGGIPGGVVGGVVGGVPLPPPPAPPAPLEPQAPPAPVRVGGTIQAPELVRRVNPEYPLMAQRARLGGTVIVEAVVDTLGAVTSATVARSTSPLFESAALAAVRAWQYRPLLIGGRPAPFIVTVTLVFNLPPSP